VRRAEGGRPIEPGAPHDRDIKSQIPQCCPNCLSAILRGGLTEYDSNKRSCHRHEQRPAVNPLQVARYREPHGTSGAKSDPGDAHVLAELV
jgi:hypothetical protein